MPETVTAFCGAGFTAETVTRRSFSMFIPAFKWLVYPWTDGHSTTAYISWHLYCPNKDQGESPTGFYLVNTVGCCRLQHNAAKCQRYQSRWIHQECGKLICLVVLSEPWSSLHWYWLKKALLSLLTGLLICSISWFFSAFTELCNLCSSTRVHKSWGKEYSLLEWDLFFELHQR